LIELREQREHSVITAWRRVYRTRDTVIRYARYWEDRTAMNYLFRAQWSANRSRHRMPRGFIKLNHALILAALVIVVGVVWQYAPSNSGGNAPVAGQSTTGNDPREVDFGLAELNPGKPTPVTSYKNGGNMVLYPGEELRFQVVGDKPLPPIELRVGDSVQLLPGTDGKLQIAGPANQPLPAVMVWQATRLSLPGGAPPRVSVKVQVHGAARPKK
jgi:hypothetical protein